MDEFEATGSQSGQELDELPRPSTGATVGQNNKAPVDKEESKGLMGEKSRGSEKSAKNTNQIPKKKKKAVSQLNKLAQYDKHHPLNQPFPAIENFKGPKSDRKATDIFCIAIPIVFLVIYCAHLAYGTPTSNDSPHVRLADLANKA